MEIVRMIYKTLTVAFFVCYLYQFFYIPVALSKRDTRKLSKKTSEGKIPEHSFAVLIAARNEERVIGPLIESIHAQNYPSHKLHIFVVADNCTDQTATTARNAGAFVYERRDSKLVGKGYALHYLLKQIAWEHSDLPIDGYFVLDADNVLDPDYVKNMNRTFGEGYEIVTGYRNSKNYADSWISAGYSLWFLREAKFLNSARMKLGSSCAVSGTGFLFSRRVIEAAGGWNFFLLTEDIEFTVDSILKGVKIGYSANAIFYDEQPVTFRQSFRQRLRWAKGYLQVFRKYGFRLVRGVFSKKGFSCFDMLLSIMPAIIISMVGIAAYLAAIIVGIVGVYNPWTALFSMLHTLINTYLTLFVIGLITLISEWKQIYASPLKKILSGFTFPLFMLTYIPISFVALFKKVEWKPIDHSRSVTVAEITVTPKAKQGGLKTDRQRLKADNF